KKRKEAAIDKDDELIEYYMNKLDEMRNIAKKGTLTSK
ncbi:tetratricopeptide repeat protein, partial [Streptococcus uberis]|nr:tetratricopeptide repeat protein [Streptococcus uberis]